MTATKRPVYMSGTRPPGWTLGAPKKPGQYWYAETRGIPAQFVTVEWQANPSAGRPGLVFYASEGGPRRDTGHVTGWWRV
jgi:hypothetical protein